MNYRRMGRTGLKVSEICLGTMTFGNRTDATEAQRIVDHAFAQGVNFFDTADGYSNGRSEEILGSILQGRRRQAVIATKFFNPMGPGPNDSGMSRVHIMHAVEDSLRRLQTDYIDIYYVHHVDEQTPMEEMLRALDDLVHQGKVRYIACSNYHAWRLATAIGISHANNLARFECYQPQYSLVVRDIEDELVPLCLYHDVGVVVWGPLAFGFLTGKYQPGQRSLPGTRSEENWIFRDGDFAASADDTLRDLLAVADETGKTPAQVAVRWVLQRPSITSAIVGARTLAQFQDSVGAAGWTLTDAQMERLNRVSQPRERYPWSMEKQMRARRENAVQVPFVPVDGNQ